MAANPERGEVDLVVTSNGTARTLTLRMSTNAICAMQARTGKTYGQLVDDLRRVDYASIREMVFTFLQPRHANDFKTQDAVGDLIDEAGGHNGLMPVLTELFKRNRPPTDGSQGGRGNPPDAQSGTGGNSGSTPAVSV